jgi:hypothetical protein
VANGEDKVTGMASLPSGAWRGNAVWLELVLAAALAAAFTRL